MNAPRTVLLKVFRYGPADAGPRYDEFRVPAGPRTTVLDALLAVRRRQDPSWPSGTPACTARAGPVGCGSTAARSSPA